MEIQEKMKEINSLAHRLAKATDSPEFGLWSWCEMTKQIMRQMLRNFNELGVEINENNDK